MIAIGLVDAHERRKLKSTFRNALRTWIMLSVGASLGNNDNKVTIWGNRCLF